MAARQPAARARARLSRAYSLSPHRQRHPPRVVFAVMTIRVAVAGTRIANITIGFVAKKSAVPNAIAMKPRVTAQPCQLIGNPDPNPYRLGANHSGPSSLTLRLPSADVRASLVWVLAASPHELRGPRA